MKFCLVFFMRSLCLAACGLMSAAALAKPLSPISITIEPAQPTVQGQPVEFIVRARVSMDAENLRINVLLPPTVKIISGELDWQGLLLKGEEKQLRFTATAGGAQQTIEARAFMVAGSTGASDSQPVAAQDGPVARLSATAFYVWESGAAKAASTQALPLNRVVTPHIRSRNGRNIAEYPLRP